MRNRFFLIILVSLVFSAVAINLVYISFSESRRLAQIDIQIKESSSALLESEYFLNSIADPSQIDDSISDVLQGTRIGKIFSLRNPQDQIIYQSFNTGLLKTKIPITPEWISIFTAEEYVRIRNISLPGHPDRILQVGLVRDKSALNWNIIDSKMIWYITAIIIFLFSASVVVTMTLLSPLRILIGYLEKTTSSLNHLQRLDPPPETLMKYREGFWAASDEFSSLLLTVEMLVQRINTNYRMTKSWIFQMAHELKTPLAIMRAELEKKGEIEPKELVLEIDSMNQTISQFLDWAELESSTNEKSLHAVHIASVVEASVIRLGHLSPGRIRLKVNEDFLVFTDPTHLEQLLFNLITNAIKFSAKDSPIEIRIANRCLSIKDQGPGLPQSVIERLGEPFNVGSRKGKRIVGNGLGLAWATTISKLYRWQFTVRNHEKGVEALVLFPEETLEEEISINL